MDARVIFTKRTRDALEKGLSVRERGKLLFNKLKELDESGVLSKAKSRADVARLVGYTEEQAKAGYSWVSNLITRGYLSEIIQEFTPSGKAIAEYHLTNTKPDYDYEESKRRKRKKQAIAKMAEEEIIERMTPITPIKMEITKGGITIKVEMDSHEEASKLITSIMKGEE